MSRHSGMDEYDDLGEWEGVIHHKNRKQSDGIRHKRSPLKGDNEGGVKKDHKPRRPTTRHTDLE